MSTPEDKPPEPEKPKPKAEEPEEEGEREIEIRPGMNEDEIRAAGLAIEVPYESGEAKPQRLQYADLGPEKRWTPPEGFDPRAGRPVATTTDTIDGGEPTPDEEHGGTST